MADNQHDGLHTELNHAGKKPKQRHASECPESRNRGPTMRAAPTGAGCQNSISRGDSSTSRSM